ncbi:MAG: ribosome recycling factor [Candidatus Marinamargulisbacteria bacterium]|jgi:ribosome recycling factor
MNELKSRMEKSVSSTKRQMAAFRTSRANPDLLSNITVEYYGSRVPINQVASISVPEPRVLLLNVFDQNAIKDIERAISSSDLNLNPMVDGSTIRLPLPDLTEERRKELVRLVKQQAEDGKISVRNIRREFLDALKGQEKNKEISKDDEKKQQDEIQKTTDSNIKFIDEMASQKESEILTI